MGCNSCATSRVHSQYPKATRERINALTDLSNCQDGGVQTFAGIFDVDTLASGALFTVQLAPVPGGGAGAPAAGTFLRLQPFGSQRMYLHSMQLAPVTRDPGGTPAVIADPFGAADVGTGEIRINGKEVRPTMQASFANHRPPSLFLGCNQAQQCGIFPENAQCLPGFDADNPMDIALVNFTAVDVRVAIAVQIENEAHKKWRESYGIPLATPTTEVMIAATAARPNVG